MLSAFCIEIKVISLLRGGKVCVNYILAEFTEDLLVKLEAGVDAMYDFSVIQELISKSVKYFCSTILLYGPQRWIVSFANRILTPRKNNA